MKKIPVICGVRSLGGTKSLWALSLLDMRVYSREENVNIDILAAELDDFLGYEPAGCEWEFKVVDGSSKRVQAWVSRTQMLIEKQKEKEDE